MIEDDNDKLPRRGGRGTVRSYRLAARASGPSHFWKARAQFWRTRKCRRHIRFIRTFGASAAYTTSRGCDSRWRI